MILSATIVKTPIKVRVCDECNEHIWPKTPTLKLYGMAHLEDKPYNLFFHLICNEPGKYAEVGNPKVVEAFRLYNETFFEEEKQ